eukprot:1606435-Amphidinium_carterae.1
MASVAASVGAWFWCQWRLRQHSGRDICSTCSSVVSLNLSVQTLSGWFRGRVRAKGCSLVVWDPSFIPENVPLSRTP